MNGSPEGAGATDDQRKIMIDDKDGFTACGGSPSRVWIDRRRGRILDKVKSN